jgi:serine/alanine adding enzyme
MGLTIYNPDGASRRDQRHYPDIYFTPGYGVAAASTEGGAWRCADWPGRAVVPYVLRPLSDGGYDVVSPYGYSGMYVAADCGRDELTEFWSELRQAWLGDNVATAFLRFSPLDLRSLTAARGLSGMELVRRGDTVVVRVDRGTDALWNDLAPSVRRQVRKAQRAGLTTEIGPANLTDLQHGSAFRVLYEETMARVDSSSWYVFPEDYYLKLHGGSGENLRLATARDADGHVVAAYLVLTHGDRAHYHLGASTRKDASSGVNNLLMWALLNWARDSELRVVHLGGGLAPDDSLFRFKKSFGGERAEFWTGAVVVDQHRYESLLAKRSAAEGIALDELRAAPYFPQYRMRRSG